MPTPRYCQEGLGPGHYHLLQLFAQFGGGISPIELRSAQLLDGSPAFEDKHRRFVQDKVTKYTQQARNPNSRWTVGAVVIWTWTRTSFLTVTSQAPVVDKELLYSTFKNTGIIKTLIERSDMSEDHRRSLATRGTATAARGDRSASQPAPPRGTIVRRSSRNVGFDDESADLSFSGAMSSMNQRSDDDALSQTFQNMRVAEGKPPPILRTSAIAEFIKKTGATLLKTGLSRIANPCGILANVTSGHLVPGGGGRRIRQLKLSLWVDSPEDLDSISLELDLDTKGLNSKYQQGFCGAILTVPIVSNREVSTTTT